MVIISFFAAITCSLQNSVWNVSQSNRHTHLTTWDSNRCRTTNRRSNYSICISSSSQLCIQADFLLDRIRITWPSRLFAEITQLYKQQQRHTPTFPFLQNFYGLLFGWTLWMYRPKFEVRSSRPIRCIAYTRSWDNRGYLKTVFVCLSVRPSACDVGGSGSHRSEILETNCTDN